MKILNFVNNMYDDSKDLYMDRSLIVVCVSGLALLFFIVECEKKPIYQETFWHLVRALDVHLEVALLGEGEVAVLAHVGPLTAVLLHVDLSTV